MTTALLLLPVLCALAAGVGIVVFQIKGVARGRIRYSAIYEILAPANEQQAAVLGVLNLDIRSTLFWCLASATALVSVCGLLFRPSGFEIVAALHLQSLVALYLWMVWQPANQALRAFVAFAEDLGNWDVKKPNVFQVAARSARISLNQQRCDFYEQLYMAVAVPEVIDHVARRIEAFHQLVEARNTLLRLSLEAYFNEIWVRTIRATYCALAVLCIVYGSIFIGTGSKVVDAIYLLAETVTTVGYGDVFPSHSFGALMLIDLACIVYGAVSFLGDTIQRRLGHAARPYFLWLASSSTEVRTILYLLATERASEVAALAQAHQQQGFLGESTCALVKGRINMWAHR